MQQTVCFSRFQGGRSVAEAGPEVIEALLLERSSGQEKTKDLERPETAQRIDMSIGLAQIRYVT